MKNLNSYGYTLIELLAVILVMVTVGGIITSILVSALRGENKTNASTQVRQNGDAAISQMYKSIAYAKSFDGISIDNVNFDISCVPGSPPAPTPTPTPSQYKFLKVTSFDGGQTTYACQNNTIASDSASANSSLIDTTNLTVSNCFFTCTQKDIRSAPTIIINFTLQRNASGLFENQSSIPFETSVNFRNYDAN